MENKQLDLSELQEFLSIEIEPEKLVEYLQEMTLHYARMSLVAAQNASAGIIVHDNVDSHIHYASRLFKILQNIKQPSK